MRCSLPVHITTSKAKPYLTEKSSMLVGSTVRGPRALPASTAALTQRLKVAASLVVPQAVKKVQALAAMPHILCRTSHHVCQLTLTA